jgi:two-component system chemotaxis response regulator CheY
MAKTRVLVVDDSATVRQQVGSALSQAGFEVHEAVDGADGARKIEGVSGIAAVVCDVNMPNMNGIEMIETVRAAGKHPRLPFLMLTTEGVAELKQRAKQAGAKAWMVKPFKAEVLVSAVQALIKTAG